MSQQGEMTITGLIKKIGEEINVSASYSKRELVVTTDEQYPQHILIEFPQGRCNNEMDRLQVGAKITVYINLRGREWVNPQGETKYFNGIQGWKISTPTDAPAPTPAPAPAPVQPTAAQSVPHTTDEEDDDLPF